MPYSEQEQLLIQEMEKHASEFGLLEEVQESFNLHLKDGCTVEQATMMAMYDWDI